MLGDRISRIVTDVGFGIQEPDELRRGVLTMFIVYVRWSVAHLVRQAGPRHVMILKIHFVRF
jgi:hypothetical protein